MKSIFKFAAMAFAAVAMLAACNKENPANNDGDNGGNTPAALSVDGKQWFAAEALMGADCVMDLGVTTPGTLYIAYDASSFGLPGYAAYFTGTYTVTATDATSGVITLTVEGQQAEIPYNNLNENSVAISFAIAGFDNTKFTPVDTKKAIFDGMTGEQIQ